MRVLVCGGRDYSDQSFMFGYLDNLSEHHEISTIIQGGANGADRLARLWCHSRKFRCENYPADWKLHGKAAGPIRNQQMIDEGKPDFAVAFYGGRGTNDMVKRLKKAVIMTEIIS